MYQNFILAFYMVYSFQMVCSCLLLYAMRCWDIISFSAGETQSISYNPATLIPLKTLLRTIPLAVSYLLYMV